MNLLLMWVPRKEWLYLNHFETLSLPIQTPKSIHDSIPATNESKIYGAYELQCS